MTKSSTQKNSLLVHVTHFHTHSLNTTATTSQSACAAVWLSGLLPIRWETGSCVKGTALRCTWPPPAGPPCRRRGTLSRDKSLIKRPVLLGIFHNVHTSTFPRGKDVAVQEQRPSAPPAINKSKMHAGTQMLFTNTARVCCSWVYT